LFCKVSGIAMSGMLRTLAVFLIEKMEVGVHEYAWLECVDEPDWSPTDIADVLHFFFYIYH
jgi:hypothetical protein